MQKYICQAGRQEVKHIRRLVNNGGSSHWTPQERDILGWCANLCKAIGKQEWNTSPGHHLPPPPLSPPLLLEISTRPPPVCLIYYLCRYGPGVKSQQLTWRPWECPSGGDFKAHLSVWLRSSWQPPANLTGNCSIRQTSHPSDSLIDTLRKDFWQAHKCFPPPSFFTFSASLFSTTFSIPLASTSASTPSPPPPQHINYTRPHTLADHSHSTHTNRLLLPNT